MRFFNDFNEFHLENGDVWNYIRDYVDDDYEDGLKHSDSILMA